MPHDWWLVLDSWRRSTTATVDPDQDRVIARFKYLLSHHHLLLRLYLPYVFQPGRYSDHGHGKRVALSLVATSSLDILPSVRGNMVDTTAEV